MFFLLTEFQFCALFSVSGVTAASEQMQVSKPSLSMQLARAPFVQSGMQYALQVPSAVLNMSGSFKL
jgi:hypothetical protein